MGLTGVAPATWWKSILGDIHAPDVAMNRTKLVAWQACEGGSARFNPFNTTQPEPGATNYNSAGVKNYTSFDQGVRATVATLTNGHYGPILTNLRDKGPFSGFANAVGSSPWGTSGACIATELNVHGQGGTPGGPTGVSNPGPAKGNGPYDWRHPRPTPQDYVPHGHPRPGMTAFKGVWQTWRSYKNDYLGRSALNTLYHIRQNK